MQEAGQVIPLASPSFSPAAPLSPPPSPGPLQSSRSTHPTQRRTRSRKSNIIPPARSVEIGHSKSPDSSGDTRDKLENGVFCKFSF